MRTRPVSVYADDMSTVDDVMQLLSRLPYREMLDFAEIIQADADKIAVALDQIDSKEAEKEGAA